MSAQKLSAYILALAGLAVGVLFSARFLTSKTLRVVHAQNGLVPYRAERWIYSYDAQLNERLISKEIVASDSSGTFVNFHSTAAAPELFLVRIIEQKDHLYSMVSDPIKEKSTYYREATPDLDRQASLPSQGCLPKERKERLLRTENIMGVDAYVIETTQPAAIRITEWRVPQMGCVFLKRTAERKNPDGSYSLSSQYKPMSFTLGDPPKDLLSIPSEYAEMKPSQVYSDLNKKVGIIIPSLDPTGRLDMVDQLYAAGQRQ